LALRLLAGLGLAIGCVIGAARAQVPYVPTPMEVVERMLAMAKVGAADFVIDLGSGDGRVVREAARRYGARGLGVDLNAELVARSNALALADGVADKVSFIAQDLFETDISEATVLTMYLLPAVNMKLRPRLVTSLKPGTRIVSHDFDLGDWQPDEKAELYAKDKYGGSGGNSTVLLWIVPADVSGRWRWQLESAGQKLDYELRATQRFQQVDAVVHVDGQVKKLEQVSLRGDRLDFTVVDEIKGSTVRQRFSGRIAGDEIHGSVVLSGVRMQGLADWSAARSERGFRSAHGPGARDALRQPLAQIAGAAQR
jgi:SAM-dependent methyltransferase